MGSEKKRAMKSDRSNSFSKNAIVPRIIPQLVKKDDYILDFGCGKGKVHVKQLKDQGYSVAGYDISIPGSYGESIKGKRYDVVYLSNVLNVQSNEEMLEDLFDSVLKCLLPSGFIVVNYPYDPRYLGWSTDKMLEWLKEKFMSVIRVRKEIAGNNIVWILQ